MINVHLTISSLSSLASFLCIGFILQAEKCLSISHLALLRAHGRGYKGGIRGTEIDFQLNNVYIPTNLIYLFRQPGPRPYTFRPDLTFSDVTVCFGTRVEGLLFFKQFVCPDSDNGVRAVTYADLVSKSDLKSYCCGPDTSQKCCSADEFSSGNAVKTVKQSNGANAAVVKNETDLTDDSFINPSKPKRSDDDEKSEKESKGLSKWTIAVICASSVVGVVSIGLMIFCMCKCSSFNMKPANAVPHSPQYGTNQQPMPPYGSYRQPQPYPTAPQPYPSAPPPLYPTAPPPLYPPPFRPQ